jgi:predicted outer membrane repeat protein
MKNGVQVFGDFTGMETSVSQRTNYGTEGTNETILNGDIDTGGVKTDNSYHVVFNSVIDSTSLLNGFIVTGGYADTYSEADATHGGGGRILNLNSSLEIANCCFTLNYAYFGGGILNQESSPTVTNCTFDNNSVLHQGGAIFNYHTLLFLDSCIFTGNRRSRVMQSATL